MLLQKLILLELKLADCQEDSGDSRFSLAFEGSGRGGMIEGSLVVTIRHLDQQNYQIRTQQYNITNSPNILCQSIRWPQLLSLINLLILLILYLAILNFRTSKIKLTMKSRSNSAPRMQTVYTARVKDGRISNESPQKHYYGNTGPRFFNSNSNSFYNPQNSPAKAKHKVTQQQVQQIIEKKINNFQQPVQAKANLQKNTKLNKQQTIHGRKLQFPPERFNNIQNRRQPVNLLKSTSLSSKHFVDKSLRSSAIISKKEEMNEKFKVAFGYLLDTNEAYLAERRRACIQKARPKDQIFKMPRPYANTHNNDQYQQKSTPYDQNIEPQNLKTANSFGPRKVCGNSTTNEFHNGKHGPRADLAQWPQGFKLQGPIFGVTTYGNHFPHPGDYEKMVPVAKFNEHPMGFPHKTNSTHRTFHKGDFVQASKLATWNNLHPYGNAFDPNRGTTYGKHHSQKQQPPIQQWPMYEPALLQSDGKFTTEYNSNLLNHTHHELNCQNYCHCGRKMNKH